MATIEFKHATKTNAWPPAGEEGQERVRVTPEMALAWTERKYEHQRPVNLSYVRFLISEIEAGRWKYDASTIVFDREGRLIDGQHRCHAIVGAGVPVDALIVWGVEEDAYKTKDTGRSRTASDIVSVENARDACTLARALVNYRQTGDPLNNTTKISNARIVDLINAEPEIVDAVAAINSINALRSLMSPASAAFGWFMMWKIDPEMCRTFWQSIASGAGLSDGDPRLALVRLCRNSTLRSASAKCRRTLIASVIKAWNAWRAGRRLSMIVYRSTEPFPEAI